MVLCFHFLQDISVAFSFPHRWFENALCNVLRAVNFPILYLLFIFGFIQLYSEMILGMISNFLSLLRFIFSLTLLITLFNVVCIWIKCAFCWFGWTILYMLVNSNLFILLLNSFSLLVFCLAVLSSVQREVVNSYPLIFIY